MSTAEIQLRAKLANNGRTAANDRAGIRTGSDLHLAEMILAERDALLAALKDAVESLEWHARRFNPHWDGKSKPESTIGMAHAAIAKAESGQ